MMTNKKNNTICNLQALQNRNDSFIELFRENPLMELIISEKMGDPDLRGAMLSAIQVFSDSFQKTVMLRHIFTETKDFMSITQEHLEEEFNHNKILLSERPPTPQLWDPILEATTSWFSMKMFSLNDEEKWVMMHMVLEAAANEFFVKANKAIDANYFKTHSDADQKHSLMGIELIDGLSQKIYAKLFHIQQQGWDMLNATCERIAYLSFKQQNNPSG